MLPPGYPEALANLAGALTRSTGSMMRSPLCAPVWHQTRPNPDTQAQFSETLRLAGRIPRVAGRGTTRARSRAHGRLQIQKVRALALCSGPRRPWPSSARRPPHPDDADIAAELAQLLEYAGKPAEATRAWHDVLLRDANDADALAGLIALEGHKLSPDTCSSRTGRLR